MWRRDGARGRIVDVPAGIYVDPTKPDESLRAFAESWNAAVDECDAVAVFPETTGRARSYARPGLVFADARRSWGEPEALLGLLDTRGAQRPCSGGATIEGCSRRRRGRRGSVRVRDKFAKDVANL